MRVGYNGWQLCPPLPLIVPWSVLFVMGGGWVFVCTKPFLFLSPKPSNLYPPRPHFFYPKNSPIFTISKQKGPHPIVVSKKPRLANFVPNSPLPICLTEEHPMGTILMKEQCNRIQPYLCN